MTCAPQSAADPERWLWRLRPDTAQASVTLVVMPHAGGSAQSFAPWAGWLPMNWNARVAQYPGRGARFGEPPAETVEELADELARALLTIDGPVAIFGHSLGGLVGFETAWRLQEAGRPVVGFVASASTPPQLFKAAIAPAQPISDDQLLSQLRQRGGLPADVMEHPDLLEMIFEILRSDIRLLDRYEMRDTVRRLASPVTAIGGADDPVTTPQKLAQWQARSRDAIRSHVLSGGHFYIENHAEALSSIFENELTRWMDNAFDGKASECTRSAA